MNQEMLQGTPEWLAMRKNFIGASDAPVIMGESPWKTPMALWEEKVGLREQNARTQSMQRGIDLEPLARELFTKKTGISVQPSVVFSDKNKFMMASLDGIDDSGKNVVEIKCVGESDHQCARSGKVPEKYYHQLQHQMVCTGVDVIFYFSYRNDDGCIIEVGRDDKSILAMVEEERKFYECMVNFLPPLPCEEQTSSQWKQVSSEWLETKRMRDELDAKETMLRQHLIAIAAGKNAVGNGVKLVKAMRKGNVQYDKIPELSEVDLDKYRKAPSEYWRLSA